ncbi:MAG TPA: cation diffusion facilitator family transporter [Candidatus Hydrogenedentes bacterium]|nr:cation diffusion facilitator family transporter [Candidatus Hydrogenedentota bacterium]HPG67116.1 cation diffusion facilitator family transporter [Candidatus Hydrogenedentota bacterium]
MNYDATSSRDRHGVATVTWVGLFVNLVLTVLKFTCGVVGHSQAVVADAVHSLSDMASDTAILVGVRFWTKPADRAHPHGHQRIETVVTLGIGVLLATVAFGLVWNALSTLHAPHGEAPGWVAFAAAVVSIVSKEALYRWTVIRGREMKSSAVIANAWHHRSDAFSSIPAALAVAGAAVGPGWSFLDHVGAVIVSVLILQAALVIIRPAFAALIDTAASDEDVRAIAALAGGVGGVKSVHEVRTRYVGGAALSVDLHVLVDPLMTVHDGHAIADRVKKCLIREGPDVVDAVVHIEPFEEAEVEEAAESFRDEA